MGVGIYAPRKRHNAGRSGYSMMTKDQIRKRFERKAKHVRDIRRHDYIMNQRVAVEYGAGDSHNEGAAYNVTNARNISPIAATQPPL